MSGMKVLTVSKQLCNFNLISSKLFSSNKSTNFVRSCFSSPSNYTECSEITFFKHKSLLHHKKFHSSKSYFAGGSARTANADGIVSFPLSDPGEGIAECEIKKWYIKVGDRVKEFDVLCQIESDKATTEITSSYNGVITKIYYEKGQMAKVGTTLVDIDIGKSENAPAAQEKPAAPQPSASKPSQTPSVQPAPARTGPVLASPAVRHMAAVNKIPLEQIPGTGKHGHITKEDMLQYLSGKTQPLSPKKVETPSTPQTPQPSHAPSVPVATATQEDRVVPLSGYQKTMAKIMTAANAIPHFGYSDEIIVDKLMNFRNELKPVSEKRGVKMTYMPIMIKAASLALKKFPILNCHFDSAQNALIYRAAHNIGVAVDSPHGLIVPNIKNVQELSIIEIAKELDRLVKAAKTGGLPGKDLTGGTFTLSNIGSIGGTYASPVLVVPEVAIGAIGKFQKLPRFDEKGNVVPTHVMCISWAADHRVIDGATMANFSNLWKQYLENPNTMLLDSK